jgi:hypothetical protein
MIAGERTRQTHPGHRDRGATGVMRDKADDRQDFDFVRGRSRGFTLVNMGRSMCSF